MKKKIYEKICALMKDNPLYCCLLDPDKLSLKQAEQKAKTCEDNGADLLFVGGSIMLHNNFDKSLQTIRNSVSIPVIIFPGIFDFVSPNADALLLLSVLSSRNPQMLIGEQVRAAPLIKHYDLEAIPTGYILIESGNLTSVHFMSGGMPIPRTKIDIALAHALAGQYLGMKLIYFDAGSGAKYAISDEMISKVSEEIEVPLILGGGIRSPEIAAQKAQAGADIVVTGDILEKNFDPGLIRAFADAVHSVKRS